MPVWNDEEGLWILTEAEEKAKTHPGLAHILTREEQARGGRNGTGQAKRRSPSFYSQQARMRAFKRWYPHLAGDAGK